MRIQSAKGLQSTKKQLKLFKFFQNTTGSNDIPFLQERHSPIEAEKKLIDDFNEKINYSHVKTSSFDVLIAICAKFNNIFVKHKVNHNDGRVLIL